MRTQKQQRRGGCLPLVFACATVCFLLVVNRVLVLSLYLVLVPTALDHPKFQSLVTMILIVALLFPEWWILDRLMYRIWRDPNEQARRVR